MRLRFNQNWTLNQLGNWTGFDDNGNVETREINAANEITSITPDGGTAMSLSHDLAGNTTFDGTWHYTYDAWNRLVAAHTDQVVDNEHVADDLVATYAYDGQGYRISKTVGEGELAVTTDYYYNTDWQVMEERVDGIARYQYAWEPRYIDSPQARFELDSNGDTIQTLYYLTDANMNVTSLLDGDTGELVERYVYDSYGNFRVYDADWTATATNRTAGCRVPCFRPRKHVWAIR